MVKKAQMTSPSITIETLDDYGLGGVDCPICNNRGTISYKKDGLYYARECDCMDRRRSLRRLRNSGMLDMIERYTFANYETPDDERKAIKEKAKRFCKEEKGWLFITGRSGSGKSHICTAICSEMLSQNREVYYMAWRDESVEIKANVNDAEWYQRRMKKLKTVSVLYIDDFLKGGASDADIRLAFEIINARYNDSNLRTIISSEWDIRKVLELDEALGGRIYERSRGYVLKAPNENYRLR